MLESVNSFGKIERRTVKTSREELLKNIKKILTGFPEDDATVQEFLGKIDSDTLLQKQLTASNGVIPKSGTCKRNEGHFEKCRKIPSIFK
ncbi:MAG: CRISPR-associated endonuclease Cas9 REC1/REC2 domain-containing protein [Clostridium fessum]